jgi:hypothetical protein
VRQHALVHLHHLLHAVDDGAGLAESEMLTAPPVPGFSETVAKPRSTMGLATPSSTRARDLTSGFRC